MRLKKAIKWIVAAAFLVGIGFFLRSCVPPSERSVVRNFHKHEDAFERLLVMFDEDWASSIGARNPAGSFRL